MSYPLPYPARRENPALQQSKGHDLKGVEAFWTNNKYGINKLEAAPLDVQHHTTGSYVMYWPYITWETGLRPMKEETFFPSNVHYQLVENLKKRSMVECITAHPTPQDKALAEQLIQDILQHQKVAHHNWIFYLESQGWDAENYKDWVAAPEYYSQQDLLNRAAAVEQGKAVRQKWVAQANEFVAKLHAAMKEAADEARPFFDKWASAEGLVTSEGNNAVLLNGAEFQPGYNKLATYKEQPAAVKKQIDAWVGKNFPGGDGEGIITNANTNISDYLNWIQKCFIKLLREHMKKIGAPEVADNAYEGGLQGTQHKQHFGEAFPYWGRSANGKLDVLQGVTLDVVGGFDPRTDRGGASIRPYGINSPIFCVFQNRSNFFCPKVNWSKVVPDADLDEFPNKSEWRRPPGYGVSAQPVNSKPAGSFIGDVPNQAEKFLDWTTDKIENIGQLNYEFESRLKILEGGRDKVKRRIEEEAAKKRGATDWEPFNETPKDTLEASSIFQKRMAEWTQKDGKDLVKMGEIQSWFQAQVARISAEMQKR